MCNRNERIVSSFLVSSIIFLILLSSLSNPVTVADISSWGYGTNYPESVYGVSCSSFSDNIYCVGGDNGTGFGSNGVYYANPSQYYSTWNATTSYPEGIKQTSCVTNLGFIYCVGGRKSGSISDVYYANVSSTGVGKWIKTKTYPMNSSSLACATSFGYAYCIGGGSNSTYYAKLLSTGVGTWIKTTSYPFPVSLLSCVTSSGYVYCVDGNNTATGKATSVVYYAPVTSTGIGTWVKTTSYPLPLVETDCVTNSSNIYCIGGDSASKNLLNLTSDVFYAPLTPGGVSPWRATASYINSILGTSCVTASSYIFCITGGDSTFLTDSVGVANFLNETTTSLRCSSNKVSTASTVSCTATITGYYPSGSVSWSSNSSSYSINTTSCTLTLENSSSACSVRFLISSPGASMIVAEYTGDSLNAVSNASIVLEVYQSVQTSVASTGSTSSNVQTTTESSSTSFSNQVSQPNLTQILFPPLAGITFIVLFTFLIIALWRRRQH